MPNSLKRLGRIEQEHNASFKTATTLGLARSRMQVETVLSMQALFQYGRDSVAELKRDHSMLWSCGVVSLCFSLRTINWISLTLIHMHTHTITPVMSILCMFANMLLRGIGNGSAGSVNLKS